MWLGLLLRRIEICRNVHHSMHVRVGGLFGVGVHVGIGVASGRLPL